MVRRPGNRRFYLGWAQLVQGETADAVARFAEVVADAEANHDAFMMQAGLSGLGTAMAYRGEVSAARAAARQLQEAAVESQRVLHGDGPLVLSLAALADGDVAAARRSQ